jgi:hypothetical protein
MACTKIMDGFRRPHYLASASIFVIAARLVVVVVGCSQSEYTPMAATGYYHTVALRMMAR